MSSNVRVLKSVKAGNAVDECEDFCHYMPDGTTPVRFIKHPSPYRFAIADGATESSFSAEWAELLTTRFAQTDPTLTRSLGSREGRATWLQALRDEWHNKVPWDRLGWASLEKAKRGAHATFLGLQLYPRSWMAWAVGDCAIFQVRSNQLLSMWPMEGEADFGSSPALLCSVVSQSDLVLEDRYFLHRRGRYQSGDLFILATDALAKWFICHHGAGGQPWRVLDEISDNARFDEFVTELRREGRIQNDDTTAMIIRARGALL